MGRSGCRLPGHNGSEALVFPLHTNAQPQHRRAAPAAALSLPCGSEPIFPLSQQHAELGETSAVSAAPAMPEEPICFETQTSALARPHTSQRGGLACRSCCSFALLGCPWKPCTWLSGPQVRHRLMRTDRLRDPSARGAVGRC